MIIPRSPKPTFRSILTQLLIFALSITAIFITCTMATGSAIAQLRSVANLEPLP